MKELDPETTRVITWIENIKKECRLRHVVVWVGGNESQANRWSDQYGVQVAVVPADSGDLAAWNVDPRHGCSVVLVERNLALGGLADIGAQTEIDFRVRVMAMAEEALEMKHGHARMWGRSVTRNLAIEPTPIQGRKPLAPVGRMF